MKNRKIIYWALQFASWGFFCFLLTIASIIQGTFTLSTIFHIIKLYLLLILFSHGIRWLLIKLEWLNLKMTQLLPRILGLVVALAFLMLLVNNLLNFVLFNEPSLKPVEYLVNILLYGLFFFMWTAAYFAYHLTHKSRVQELNNLRLQARKTENELKNLRDQLNPHFLFNSLNSIRALIRTEPETATSAITTLSSLLRRTLYIGNKTLVAVKDEVELVKEYLKLEKIRYEERLEYTMNSTLNNNFFIPPFLLQGMVENAIKHGIAKLAAGGEIEISIGIEKEQLILKVINSGEYIQKKGKGIGINNTIRRLSIVYGDNAGFEIRNKNEKVETLIWINKMNLKETLYGSDNN